MAAVIVHGGAYAIPDSLAEASLKGCQSAAKLAHLALLEGKPALDSGRQTWIDSPFSPLSNFFFLLFLYSCVVEIAIKKLEDDPTFDAGHGSVLNAAGQIEMDAIIMDGSKRTCCEYPDTFNQQFFYYTSLM